MNVCTTYFSLCIRGEEEKKGPSPSLMLSYSMSRKLDNPVQTQMAVSIHNHTLGSEVHGINIDVKTSARRRLFVQTDTGCVLGVEVDRRDRANTVKRRIQLALNLPNDESSLTFGDHVLKDDLTVCNDSALLLTRNSMQRSLSTPCLSPTGKDIQQGDRSGPIEILGCPSKCFQTKQLVEDVVKAIKNDIEPIPVPSGLGGAYYFKNTNGDNVAIVKPTDEEPFAPNNPKGFAGKALGQPGLNKSVRVGETGFREVAAYLLDKDHFAKVPPTVLVKVTHSVFHSKDINNHSKYARKPKLLSKIASFQQFIPHDFDASDHGTSSFPVADVHRIGILDVRIFNTDRHAGNLLVRKASGCLGNFDGQMELIPIDHGLCLPETLEDPYFEWIYWPQASIPFSDNELEYIANLNPKKDVKMLRMELPMIREACLRVLVLCTIFLKVAAKFGLCLSEIGEIMTRGFKGATEEPSGLEVICMEAMEAVQNIGSFSFVVETAEEKEFQFDLDCEETFFMPTSPSSLHFGFKSSSNKNPFSKIVETLEEQEDEGEEDEGSLLKLSMLPKGLGFSRNSEYFPDVGLKGLISENKNKSSKDMKFISRNRSSAEKQVPSSATFVNLADMGKVEWGAFLEKFQELLPSALKNRKCVGAMGLRTRLGNSCQF